MTDKTLNLLLVEDSPDDADLLSMSLKRGGFKPLNLFRVETAAAFRAALAQQMWDIIISDVSVPSFGAQAALAILTEEGIDIPFIVISGHLRTEDAVSMMRAGAEDFVQKDDMARLVPAVERALRDARMVKDKQAAAEQAQRFGRILDESVNEILWVDAETLRIVHANKGACRNLHMESEKVEQLTLYDLACHDEHTMRKQLAPLYDGNVVQIAFEEWFKRDDGTVYPVDMRAQLLSGTLVILAIDISEKKKTAMQLRKLSQAVEQSPTGVVIIDNHGLIEYINQSYLDMMGYENAEMTGRNLIDFITPQSPSQRTHQLQEAINAQETWRGELHTRRKDGTTIWEYVSLSPILGEGESRGVQYFLVMLEDITVRKEYEQKLMRQASYDELTKLPNRLLAFDRLSVALAESKRENTRVALFFIDLDNFKNVNDTLGHFAGDALLIEAAGRLQSCVRESTTLARFGGDEFVVVMPNIDTPNAARLVSQRILKSFQPPFNIHGREIYISASIGITIFPDDGENTQVLLQNADAAMYQAKESGRNNFCFFTPEMNKQAAQRLSMEVQMRRALNNKELYMVYQPVVSARTLRVVACEALIRWQNPELGLVSPDQFIPLAEEIGLIVPIGEWLLHETTQAVAGWQQYLKTPLRLAVNVSARQFGGAGLISVVQSALSASKLTPELLELEITERLVLNETSSNSNQLHKLNDMGVRLSVDDFGTGYSALSYLKRFPFDVLKIDRSFVRDITRDRDNAALAKAIIAMAHGLDMQVIAEGVESAAQRDFLVDQQCDMMQGYYFSRPLPPDDFLQMLKDLEARHDGDAQVA